MVYSYAATALDSPEPRVWGTPVKNKLWGNGAGGASPAAGAFPATGYNVCQLHENKRLWFSTPIMAGYLSGAEAADQAAARDPTPLRQRSAALPEAQAEPPEEDGAAGGGGAEGGETKQGPLYRNWINAQLLYFLCDRRESLYSPC